MPRIYISDAIDKNWGVSARMVRAQIDAIQNKNEKLEVIINSPGGSIFEGLEMYHAIKAYAGDSETIVAGVAASMASIVMLATKKTSIAKGSTVMIHNPLTFVYGNANDMRETAEVLDTIREELVSIYASKSGKDKEDIKQMLDKESWFGGEDAVTHGFADSVVEGYTSSVSGVAAVISQESIHAQMTAMKSKLTTEEILNYKKQEEIMNITKELVLEKALEVAEGFRAEGRDSVDLEKIKAEAIDAAKPQILTEAIKAEKERISGIIDAFDGTGLKAESKQFIDEGKTVNEAVAFALAHVKAQGAKHLQNLKDNQPNLNADPTNGDPEPMTEEEAAKKAIQNYLPQNAK